MRKGVDKRLYNAWSSMRDRCNNPNNQNWDRYGGRGIRVCKRWSRFENFAADMGPHPGEGWTLDRRNGNGNYHKKNCQWATRLQQARNRAYVKLNPNTAAEIRQAYEGRGGRWGGTIRQQDLANKFGVSQVLVSRIVRGLNWREMEVTS